jgi:hypothetical protein
MLDRLKIEYHNFYDFSVGTSFSDLIKRKIRESDFVLALINDNNQNVLFELGVAQGLNKPMFLLVKKDVKLPFYLEDKLYFQTDWDKDTDLIELSLKNYIDDISKKTSKVKKQTKGFNLTIDETNDFVIQIKKFRKEIKEADLINLLMQVFSKLKINAVSEMLTDNKARVDIAVINENLSQYFGNPLLFEVKSGILTNSRIESAENQLQKYIELTDAKAGVLLYLDRENKRFEYGNRINPFILRFDIEDFILGVASEGFEKLLIKTRNELVHGKIK